MSPSMVAAGALSFKIRRPRLRPMSESGQPLPSQDFYSTATRVNSTDQRNTF